MYFTRRKAAFALPVEVALACLVAGNIAAAQSPIADFTGSRFAPYTAFTEQTNLPPDAPESAYVLPAPTASIVVTGAAGPNVVAIPAPSAR